MEVLIKQFFSQTGDPVGLIFQHVEYFSSRLSLTVLCPSPMYLSFLSISSLICLPILFYCLIFCIEALFITVSTVAMVASMPILCTHRAQQRLLHLFRIIIGEDTPPFPDCVTVHTDVYAKPPCSKEPITSFSIVTSSLHSIVTLMPTSRVRRKPLEIFKMYLFSTKLGLQPCSVPPLP
jgi:hypothetical protein